MFARLRRSLAVELGTLGKVPGLEAQVRHALAEVNPDLPVIDFRSLEDDCLL
jgi:hypothetical protein